MPYYNSAELTPIWYDPASKEIDNIHKIPSFKFTNQDGKSVSNESMKGKIYVVSFFFATCPAICTTVNLRLRQIQQEFLNDDKVQLISHSITPEIDTVEALHEYAKKHSIESGKWNLVTGKKSEIYQIARQGYFADEDLGKPNNKGNFLHTDNILLIDHNGRIRGVYSGMSSYAMFNLTDDIKLLKKELNTI
ncbi:hypothetical protein LPB140_03665 [Sphingorhabdus lutea]|uniref:Thioredoxin domain-containing protein n=1 Tax=Sphingorhabdus lutea TaxID=1913578 RepID=A0A1L3JEL7_9SPHN|nr:hypothetical protein LPB140_03665 [Sphingorhabdus lutea]